MLLKSYSLDTEGTDCSTIIRAIFMKRNHDIP